MGPLNYLSISPILDFVKCFRLIEISHRSLPTRRLTPEKVACLAALRANSARLYYPTSLLEVHAELSADDEVFTLTIAKPSPASTWCATTVREMAGVEVHRQEITEPRTGASSWSRSGAAATSTWSSAALFARRHPSGPVAQGPRAGLPKAVSGGRSAWPTPPGSSRAYQPVPFILDEGEEASTCRRYVRWTAVARRGQVACPTTFLSPRRRRVGRAVVCAGVGLVKVAFGTNTSRLLWNGMQ